MSECIGCGTCVPWICPCGETNCNWFDAVCERCGVKPTKKVHDTRRAMRDLDELRAELEKR